MKNPKVCGALVLLLSLSGLAFAAPPCPPILLIGSVTIGEESCGDSGGEPVSGFFIDSNSGSDGNNGTSPQSAWRTLNKVGSSVSGSDDVWLLAGPTHDDQNFSLRLSGTPGDPVKIGCYDVSNGTAQRCQ